MKMNLQIVIVQVENNIVTKNLLTNSKSVYKNKHYNPKYL